MASNIRTQLENWLKTIDVKGSVLDVGGIHLPIKGRTKSWDVENYKLLDAVKEYKEIVADYQEDLNKPTNLFEKFDSVFCIETLYQMYDPMTAFKNLGKWMVPNGRLFLSVHFMFPYHDKVDCIRLTRHGLQRLLALNGFEVVEVIPRIAAKPEVLKQFSESESKVSKYPDEIGYLIEAKKL